MLNGLDLFSGIGGLSVALSPWVIPRAYCEKEPYAQAVLLSRMRDGSIPWAPIWDDVRSLSERMVGPEIDIIYGGFPCQDISTLGTKKGLEGERSGLFYEITRLASDLNPTFIFLENVSKGFRKVEPQVFEALEKIGYTARAIEISAFSVGANQERVRWFCLAHRNSEIIRVSAGRWERKGRPKETGIFSPAWWTTEPGIPGMAYGVPYRVDRHRAMGNAVVPLQAREAFKRLMGLE